MCRKSELYICNPLKHTKCKKNICGILNNDPLDLEDRCFLTVNKDHRLELTDLTCGLYPVKQIKKWIEDYYGKEGQANGRDKWNID